MVSCFAAGWYGVPMRGGRYARGRYARDGMRGDGMRGDGCERRWARGTVCAWACGLSRRITSNHAPPMHDADQVAPVIGIEHGFMCTRCTRYHSSKTWNGSTLPSSRRPPNLRHANTEPYILFVRFIDRFDTAVKVSTSAINKMRDSLASAEERSRSVVVDAGGWSPKTVDNPEQTISTALQTLSGLWVLEALAAFEHYLVRVQAELERWADIKAVDSGISNNSDSDSKVERLYDAYSWAKESISPYLPTLEYLQFCRNCMAHRAGVVSEGLEMRQLPDGYADGWPQLRGNPIRAPAFPRATVNEYLKLEPSHGIFAIALCNRLAKDVNQKLVGTLGITGMIYHAAHHALLEDESVPIEQEYLARRHSPNEAISHVLESRYNARDVPPEQVASTLRDLNVWSRIPTRYTTLVEKARRAPNPRRR